MARKMRYVADATPGLPTEEVCIDNLPDGGAGFSGSYNDLTDKPTIPTIPGNATSSTAGLMSASDKAKLDGIATGANNYSLPAAATGAIGGVRMSAHVASAAGENVTAAEFEALLDALEAAGIVSEA